MPRVRGLAPWNPHGETLKVLNEVTDILGVFQQQLPLTLRQIYYQLVVNGYDKTQKAYARLSDYLSRARRSGRMSWDSMRDDGFSPEIPHYWEKAADIATYSVDLFRGMRLDRTKGQPRKLLLLVESAGMQPQISRVANPYGVPVIASGGFDSVTAKYELAQMIVGWAKPCRILHIGDHDVAGVDLFNACMEDVSQLVNDIAKGNGPTVEFQRLAVTPEQIIEFNLPISPPKVRATAAGQRKADKFGGTVEADALRPDILAEIVRQAIKSNLWDRAYQTVLRQERMIRELPKAELLALFGEAVANE